MTYQKANLMAVYAIATDGPLDQPNGKRLVEILTQINEFPTCRFRCRIVKTGVYITTDLDHLKLAWHEVENPNRT